MQRLDYKTYHECFLDLVDFQQLIELRQTGGQGGQAAAVLPLAPPHQYALETRGPEPGASTRA